VCVSKKMRVLPTFEKTIIFDAVEIWNCRDKKTPKLNKEGRERKEGRDNN